MAYVNPTPARFTSVILRLALAPAVLTLGTAFPTQAAVFRCASGDVACLVDAINQSNTNGERNTIRLEAGTYALSAIDNDTNGATGLPSITGRIVIRGQGAAVTSITRASSAPAMRLLHVGASGQLTVHGVTLTGGGATLGVFPAILRDGAALLNDGGVVNITRSVVSANRGSQGGGLANNGGAVSIRWSTFATNFGRATGGSLFIRGGVVRIADSQFDRNGTGFDCGSLDALGATVVISNSSFHGNGICAISIGNGTLLLTNSSLTKNGGEFHGGLVIGTEALALVANTTFFGNRAVFPPGLARSSAINNSGTLLLLNSTLAGNGGVPIFNPPLPIPTLRSDAGATTVVGNTIIGANFNSSGVSDDCVGPITSLGHNLISNTTGCAVALQGTDRTGDPGLGAFLDDGSPGNGHIPLVAGSQAINAGSEILCSRRDQIGNRRIRPCDIGAIEFQSTSRGRAKVTADHSAGGRADLSKLLADLEHVASELPWVTANDADALKEIGSLVDQVTRLARGRKSANGDKNDK